VDRDTIDDSLHFWVRLTRALFIIGLVSLFILAAFWGWLVTKPAVNGFFDMITSQVGLTIISWSVLAYLGTGGVLSLARMIAFHGGKPYVHARAYVDSSSDDDYGEGLARLNAYYNDPFNRAMANQMRKEEERRREKRQRYS